MDSRGCRAVRFKSRALARIATSTAPSGKRERQTGKKERRAAPKGTPRPYLVLPLNKCARVTCPEGQCCAVSALHRHPYLRTATRESTVHRRLHRCAQSKREREKIGEGGERSKATTSRTPRGPAPTAEEREGEREKRDSCVRTGHLENKYRCYPTCNCRVGSACERLRGLVCGRRLHSGKRPPRATAIPWHIISGVPAGYATSRPS